MSNGWIGVDLDGTLAHYDGWQGVEHIGEPVPAMLERVLGWIEEGRDVRIFTARVADPLERETAGLVVEAWCLEHLGRILPVTHSKDMEMVELWDDRAVGVEKNIGQPSALSPDGTPWWMIAQRMYQGLQEAAVIRELVTMLLKRRPLVMNEELMALDQIINPKEEAKS